MPPPPSETRDRLVRSCCRWNCGSPTGLTVGIVTAIVKAERPGDGRLCNASRPIEAPNDAFDVSINGAWPLTVSSSAIWPTSMMMSSVMNCWVPIRIPFWSNVLNPWRTARRV